MNTIINTVIVLVAFVTLQAFMVMQIKLVVVVIVVYDPFLGRC